MSKRRLILVLVWSVIPIVGGITLLVVWSNRPIKAGVKVKNFKQIRVGMSKSEVEAILGKTDGTLYNFGVGTWKSKDCIIQIVFDCDQAIDGCCISYDPNEFLPLSKSFIEQVREFVGV